MSRGNRKEAIFRCDEDYESFFKMIKMNCNRFRVKLHSYCLMTNHFHLLLETADVAIWQFMCKLLQMYAVYFNTKYKYTGHLFEKRYTSCLIEDDIYFLEASRYIHLNPVKAGMVSEAENYEYSSYENYILDGKDSIIDKTRVLALVDNNCEKYRSYVESKRFSREKELIIQKLMGEDDNWLPW